MILSDQTIRRMLAENSLTITPLEDGQIQPASVDIRLGDTFSIVEDSSSGIISMDKEIHYKTIQTDSYLLLPGQFVLASTMEYFRLPDDLTAFVEGRSSLGRMGLFIQNAGWVDPGFEGEITLELFNANRCAIQLKAGRRVGQLVFAKMDACALKPYRGKYQGQRGATGSRIFLDPENKKYAFLTLPPQMGRFFMAAFPFLSPIHQPFFSFLPESADVLSPLPGLQAAAGLSVGNFHPETPPEAADAGPETSPKVPPSDQGSASQSAAAATKRLLDSFRWWK